MAEEKPKLIPSELLGGVGDWLYANPKAIDAFYNITSYRPLDPANKWKNVLGGAALVGAPVAAASVLWNLPAILTEKNKKRKKEKIKSGILDTLAAGAIGAGIGGLGGAYGPGLAQKGIGRIVTNAITPHMYHDNHIDAAAKGQFLGEEENDKDKRNIISKLYDAIILDKKFTDNDSSSESPASPARQLLFRDGFNLGERYEGERADLMQRGGLKEVTGDERFLDLAPKKDMGILNKWYEYNQHNPIGANELDGINRTRDNYIRSREYEMENNPDTFVDEKYQKAIGNTMGNYLIHRDGRISDPWDFELKSKDKLVVEKIRKNKDSSTSNVKTVGGSEMLRALVSMFVTPSVMQAKVKPL